ncbi:MAG TPA: hypothetical protein VGL17_09750 [Gemmatimonadaceae bacterium]
MSTIDKSADVMTLVNGFISANIHKSLDGKKVVSYAQSISADTFV